MLYVHVAEAHHRELPEIVREKARGIDDPDQRVLAMLGERGSVALTDVRGSGVAGYCLAGGNRSDHRCWSCASGGTRTPTRLSAAT